MISRPVGGGWEAAALLQGGGRPIFREHAPWLRGGIVPPLWPSRDGSGWFVLDTRTCCRRSPV